jgi:hypothetical protein
MGDIGWTQPDHASLGPFIIFSTAAIDFNFNFNFFPSPLFLSSSSFHLLLFILFPFPFNPPPPLFKFPLPQSKAPWPFAAEGNLDKKDTSQEFENSPWYCIDQQQG